MKRILIAGLECWVYGLKNGSEAPVVFFCHGLTQSIQFSHKYCKSLAENGCIAIAVDHRNHGARIVDFAKNQKGSESYLMDTYGMYTGTARDISHIIDFLPGFLNFNPKKIGVMGFSLGAHASFVTAVIDERIDFIIPICGTPDRKSMLKNRFIEKGGTEKEFEQSLPLGMNQNFQKYDAVHNLENFSDCSAFLISGGDDFIVPVTTNEHFLKLVEEKFGQRDEFFIKVYPGATHEVTKSMWSDILTWIGQQ